MNIQAISGAANFSVGSVSSVKTAQSNAAQEASETEAVTKKEAAKGDQQAIRKLAAQQQQAAPSPASPEGIGKVINLSA